jgi:cytochrome c biogenesis protein CcdA
MVSLILLICGAALVVLGVLVLTTVVHLSVAWWILMLVGAALILFGWHLRYGPRRPVA